ncbi:MAG: aryl-sulfate sulfotransferase [Terriglobales bacterium]
MTVVLFAAALLAACGGARSAPAAQLASGASDGVAISAMAPNLAIEGGPAFTLTVAGTGFTSQSVLKVGGQGLSTHLEGNGSLQATVPASAVARRGDLPVTVSGSAPATLHVVPSGVVSPTQNPLVADYAFGAPIGANVSVEFGVDGVNYPWPTMAQAIPGGGGRVNVLVAGMQANSEYHMRAVIALPDGETVYDLDHTFETGTIPANLVPAVAPNPAAGSPDGGLVTIDMIPPGGLTPGPEVVTDTQGRTLWYYEDPNYSGDIQGMKRLADGNLLFEETNSANSSILREIDLAGDTLRQLTLTQLNAELKDKGVGFQVAYLNHDVLPTPEEHIVLIGNIYKTFTNLTCCEGQSVNVAASVLIDLNSNWIPDWTWNAFDHLNVNRIEMAGVWPDWIHGNAVLYTADHDLLFSMRHQSWIAKIEYADGGGTGAVLWKLGYQGDFTLTPNDPSQWFYGQHKPSILADNGHQMTLAVWDDGNSRVMNSSGLQCGVGTGPPCYSRAVVYQINQDARTAQEIFQYKPGPFDFWGGNAEQLANGDIAFDITAGLPYGSEVMEVTDSSTPQVVWSMAIDQIPNSANAYRAYRIGSLYQGITWDPTP